MRITPESIGRVWGIDGASRGRALGIEAKSVPSPDEDTVTIAVEAARAAVTRAGIYPRDIGAIYCGSESHPYAVKPTATVVAEAIGATPDLTAADFEFACKAGTAAIQTCLGFVTSGMAKYGMAVGADTSQGAPGDALEYSASAGGAAFVIGTENVVAEVRKTLSYTTDTPDFWRREGQLYPTHAGRFTGAPAYFKHIRACAERLMEAAGTEPGDYQHAVFHQPNGKFPLKVAKDLGFTKEQVATGLLTPRIGNTYSGAVPLGLAAVLDVVNAGDNVLVVSYGSGAGSDGFDIAVTDTVESYARDRAPTVMQLLARTREVDYAIYAKYRDMIKMRGD